MPHWPEDVETVTVKGESRDILAADAEALRSPADVSGVVRLLARSTCSFRDATASSSYPARRTARTSGARWAVPVASSSDTRSSAPGDRVPQGRSYGWPSTPSPRFPT